MKLTACVLLIALSLPAGCLDRDDGVALRERALQSFARSIELTPVRIQPRVELRDPAAFFGAPGEPAVRVGIDVETDLINRSFLTLRLDSLRLELLTHEQSELGPMPERRLAAAALDEELHAPPGDTVAVAAELRIDASRAGGDLLHQLTGGRTGYRIVATGILRGDPASEQALPLNVELIRGVTDRWHWDFLRR